MVAKVKVAQMACSSRQGQGVPGGGSSGEGQLERREIWIRLVNWLNACTGPSGR